MKFTKGNIVISKKDRIFFIVSQIKNNNILICSDFSLSNKVRELYFNDVVHLFEYKNWLRKEKISKVINET